MLCTTLHIQTISRGERRHKIERSRAGRDGRSTARGRALEKIQFLSNQDAGAREDGAVHAELEMKEMMGIEKDMGEERVEGQEGKGCRRR